MKPTVILNEKPPVVVSQPSVNDRSKAVLMKRTVLVTVCLVLLCACTLSLGLYFGLKGRQPTVVENHVYFKGGQGEIVPADVLVTKYEECFSFENADVVYDFSTGLTVYRSKRPGEMENGCLVESFNMTEKEKPSDLKSELENDRVLGWTDFEEFRVTSVWLNDEALGPKSQDLCADDEIRFIERLRDGDGIDDDKDIEDEDLPDFDGGDTLEKPRFRKRRGWFRQYFVWLRIRLYIRFSFGKKR